MKVTQPQYDSEPIVKAAPIDLDQYSTKFLIQKMRNQSSSIVQNLNDYEILHELGALAQIGEKFHPTLAGLLTMGANPQHYFPQLSVTIVVLPTEVFGDRGIDGKRFRASRRLNGTIQHIAETARRELAQFFPASENPKSYEGRRRNTLLNATRLLIYNSLIERDYSPHSRGSSMQIELYPDRLVLHYPGSFNMRSRYNNPVIRSLLDSLHILNSDSRIEELSEQLSTVQIPAPLITQSRQRVNISILR